MSASASGETLWDRWLSCAQRWPDRDAIVHWMAGRPPVRIGYRALIGRALQLARAMGRRGIGRGDICGIMLRHNENLYPLYLGVVALGAVPALLAYPNPRLHVDKFRQGFSGMARRSGLDWLFTERELESTIAPLLSARENTIKTIHFPLEWKCDDEADRDGVFEAVADQIDNDEPALLQHSSGTTGLQKAVVLSHRAILEHIDIYSSAIEITDSDRVVSWLPLYHDMGLIAAFHLPLARNLSTVQIDPFEWVRRPSLLLEVITEERGTVMWLPNFAFNMMSDKISDEDLEGVDLSSVRLVINCSEPIRKDSHDRFLRRFSRYGLKDAALSSAYAMAESTFAVTQSPPGRSPGWISVDRDELRVGRVRVVEEGVEGRVCLSSGRLLSGCEIRLVDDERREFTDGHVGEVAIRSGSLFSGYHNYPEKTAEVLDQGWYYTGDFGFTHEGEYFIVGRKKDLIIVGGNNIYPEDVEDAVSEVDGVLPGRVVAFGMEDPGSGSETIAVIAETSIRDAKGQRDLKNAVLRAAMSVDISVRYIYLVEPRWLIKSSSGKPSRKINMMRIADVDESAAKGVVFISTGEGQ